MGQAPLRGGPGRPKKRPPQSFKMGAFKAFVKGLFEKKIPPAADKLSEGRGRRLYSSPAGAGSAMLKRMKLFFERPQGRLPKQAPPQGRPSRKARPASKWIQLLLRKILFVKSPLEQSWLFPRAIACLVMALWGLSFFNDTNFAENPRGAADSILHNADLAIHEAGHLVFRFGGQLLHALGGTLMQLLVPLAVMARFLWQRDNFEASVGLWWLGQNFLDIAPYIYDAHDKKMPLTGGGTGMDSPETHDWHYILTATGNMEHYAWLASLAGNLGKLLLLLSVLWGAAVLWRGFLQISRRLREAGPDSLF